MESESNVAPLVVIVGPTASGKSKLAMHLAQQFNGEIIAADSRTIYRMMDIGTAKPSPDDRAQVAHHLLDIADPNESVTVALFKQKALAAIDDISRRGKLPILVGGSGLYIDAVLFDFSFRRLASTSEREHLQILSVGQLQKLIQDRKLPMPVNNKNVRHLVRTLETAGQIPERSTIRTHTLVIGLWTDREILKANIQRRIEAMFEAGLVQEIATLATRYGWDAPALQTTTYKPLRRYLDGEITLNEAKEQLRYNDLHLAKRQKTWFKRNPAIHWLCEEDEAVDLVTTFLNK